MKTQSHVPVFLTSLGLFFIGVFSLFASPSLHYQESEIRTIPITEWVGERFIFLGRDPSLQHYGYLAIYPANQVIGSLPYKDYVGKIVKITNVSPTSTRVSGAYNVEMTVEETGERLRALAVGGGVDGLGSVRDIEYARALYIGKTLWRDAGSLQRFDERSGQVSFISVDPFETLKVIAVMPGWHNEAPVRIVVRTSSGIEGFVDVNVSGTNIPNILRNSHRFENQFRLTPPPRESAAEAARSYKPSDEAIARAAQGKDILGWQQSWWGMTANELVQTFGDSLEKLPKPYIYSKLYAEYIIPNYNVGKDPYTVIFQMDNRTHRLAQVLILSEEFPKDSPYLSQFDRLEALLSQKYGTVRYKRDKDESLINHERQWVFPTTTIELSYTFIKGVSNEVSIRYYPTASSDANKL